MTYKTIQHSWGTETIIKDTEIIRIYYTIKTQKLTIDLSQVKNFNSRFMRRVVQKYSIMQLSTTGLLPLYSIVRHQPGFYAWCVCASVTAYRYHAKSPGTT